MEPGRPRQKTNRAEDLRLHFGRGTHAVIDRLEIRWPGGVTEARTKRTADRVIRLVEGGTVRQ